MASLGIFHTELRSYLRWVRAMELARPADRNQIARTYKGKCLTLYTRVGPDPALQSAPVVCLANITIRPEQRGLGLFTSILTMFEDHHQLLQAEWITVESVGNPRLARKLDSYGFSRFELSFVNSSPSFYRRLPEKA